MNLKRILRHLLIPAWRISAAFPTRTLKAVEAAIHASEATHSGQIRFAIETSLDLWPLLRGIDARTRALDVFSQLRVWDTEHNNGVLIYLLLADRDVEIVADRGINRHVGTEEWEKICRMMELHFHDGRFEQGLIDGIRAIGDHLTRHYPGTNRNNELPDVPVVL